MLSCLLCERFPLDLTDEFPAQPTGTLFFFLLFLNLSKSTNQSLRPAFTDCTCIFFPHFHFPTCMYFAVVALSCVVLCYRRSEVPGGGPGLEGIRGGGEPMPISGSCVNRKPCRRRGCKWQKTYLSGVWTPQLHNKIYRSNKSADNNKEKEQHGQVKRAVQSDGCLIRGGGGADWSFLFVFFCWFVFSPQTL